jgi:hypothetical protein
MKTSTKALFAFGLMTVIGCTAQSTDDVAMPDEAPGSAIDGQRDGSEGTDAVPMDFDQTLDARRTEASARGRTMLDTSSAASEVLRRNDMDPEAARREAQAIDGAKDDELRAALLEAFTAKYARIAEELGPMLPPASEGLELDSAEVDDVPSTEGYQTRAHTACTTTHATAPYASSSPPPPAGSLVQGFMSVLATGGFADEGTSKFTVRTRGIAVSSADSTIRVNASFALEAGRVEVWSALFGYANAGVSLNLVVRSSDGRVICSQERKLADIGVNTGHVNHTIPAATYGLSCSGARARGSSLGVSAEVTLGAWNGVGGVAGAHAQARGRLLSVSASNCVEPGIFFDGSGLCVSPVAPVSGSSLRINACNDDVNGKWNFDSTAGTIRHRNTSMCLTVDPLAPTIGNGTNVVLRPCNGSAHQRWTRLSDGKLRSQAAASPAPGFCLDGWGFGAPGAPLQMWRCLSPAGNNQKWFFQP